MSATTFSYAQAARGRAISQPSQQEASSPAPSTTGSQGKDDASSGATSITAPSVASTAPEARDTEQAAQPQVESTLLKQDQEVASVANSNSSAAYVAEQSGKTSEEASVKSSDARPQARSQSEDKASRSTSRTSRFNDSADGRKGRKGKKGRAADKDAPSDQTQDEDSEKVKEVPKPVILTEAPPPTVNPWAKRMEAQKAAVQIKLGSDNPTVDGESKQNTSQEESNVRSTAANGTNGDRWAQKKTAEASRPTDQAPRRGGPRGNRAGDKEERASVALPPVADPSSWPDPKAAAEREQTAKKPQEKVDTAEKDGLEEVAPARKKTWEKLEIEHSVVFQTPLPPLRGPKPRGGAPRGGRETGSMRGGHTGAAASQTNLGSVADKAASPGGFTGPKPAAARARDGNIPSRTAPQSHPPHASKRASVDVTSRDQRKPSVPEGTTEQARDASFDASSSSKRASATRDVRLENGSLNSEAGQTRAALQDRPSNFQSKGDNQQYPVREGRPERGRGGYRGRGSHNNPSSHISAASYANGHYSGPNGFGGRQNPNSHSPPSFPSQFPASFGHSSRGRGNKWASSGQAAGRNPAGFPPKAAHVNDYAVGQYSTYIYPPIFDPSIPILKAQVEYYLSVENLCKDYYLRQHMDGQGFVHLSTIAAFKRIKTVTEDLDLLRVACSLSDQIEFGIGDDGIERLRTREKWQHFVLPVSERAEAHRNDGPANFTPYMRPDAQFVAPFPGQMVPQPYPPAPAGIYPPYTEEQMYPPAFINGAAYDPAVNGNIANGHRAGQETQLSAGVPEYAPPKSPVTLESMTNFPDSQVENLMVILGYDEKDDAAGYVPGRNQAANSQKASGSTSGETGVAPINQGDQSERGIVWVDAQASASTNEQRDRKPYLEIRKTALEQRQSAKAGETPKEMQKLYRFWSQMLLKDFNAKVYQEFRDLALEDARQEIPSTLGLKCLLEFYDKLLLKTNTRKPWPQDRAVPEIFTSHMNEAVELDKKLGGKGVSTI
ncbi:hypothetical protein VTH06DRAFT_2570 [Thermothelomyces fergusii]